MHIPVCSQHAIRSKESTHFGIIVSALQVVQARFTIVVISSIAEGVYACHCTGGGEDVPPAVVGVGGYYCFCCCVGYCNDVPLQVSCIEVGFCSVVKAYEQPAFVVEKVQEAVTRLLSQQLRAVPIILRGDAVNGLAGAQPGFVIGIAVSLVSENVVNCLNSAIL